jgi:hypothetical protein
LEEPYQKSIYDASEKSNPDENFLPCDQLQVVRFPWVHGMGERSLSHSQDGEQIEKFSVHNGCLENLLALRPGWYCSAIK